MSDLAIQVERISKQYRIGGKQERYKTFRETVTNSVKTIFNRSRMNQIDNRIWALKDVTFDVPQGEVIGMIGRNGAGKSTLLKILSRITKPTSGHARVYGRVGSLLEVGTGFHPELTGRENVYLNGAIIGMKRSEIDRKFDEIISFAEIEKFLDTPVKRYSSGMYVRLAFAVAAHLEPEILLVDEVLAVGDAAFQKKCLGKMGDVVQEGRTVMFVSHNMTAISNLCKRCVLLQDGQINAIGNTPEVIEQYLTDTNQTDILSIPGDIDLTHRQNTYHHDKLYIRRIQLMNARGEPQDTFQMGQNMVISVEVDGIADIRDAMIGLMFKTRDDQMLAAINTGMTCSHIDLPRQPEEKAILNIPHVPFVPGSYWISVSIARGNTGRIDYVDRAAHFSVAEADVYGSGYQITDRLGVIFLDANWEIRHKEP